MRDKPVPILFSTVTCLASLALPARLAYSSPPRPDNPLHAIVMPAEVSILVILSQRLGQVFPV
jgi:hypothetical protein